MYLAYTDESGDSGFTNSPTTFFVISCLLVHETQWLRTLDALVELRQALARRHGIPARAELKSEYFIYGRGPIADLNWSRARRMGLFESLLDFEVDLDVTNFAVAMAKDRIVARATNDPREVAWRFISQRIDTFCRKLHPQDRVILLPDEGHGTLVRKVMRKARRFQTIPGHYGGSLDIRARYLVEDPFDKRSSESYFTQLADWNAYAAHRYRDIDPVARAPSDLWDRLGETRLLEVNELTGGPPGIVVWPSAEN
ncbi:MAG: hypothetical protein A2W34_07890 [Chloroflexi bacterium RBG_16_64_32]|nr:MAG: hypothetical protein A2W34_07890 [Chloroflexi bacterium RBG_16_64_32]